MNQIKLPSAPAASSPAVRTSMQGNKASNTRPEAKLVQCLEAAGITGFIMNHPSLPGTPDVVFVDAGLAVFVNGCFWHRCPFCHPHFPESNTEYWEAKFTRNKARDIRVRKELRQLSWKPIVIWECQLKKKPQRVLSRIKRTIEEAHG